MNKTNYTSYQTNKYQPEHDGLPVETVVIVFCILVATWIISANAVIVVCFTINRHKIWPSFSTQILSLSLCDICVGIASLPVIEFPFIGKEVRTESCGMVMYIFFASQCASINHILCLCIQRCIAIRKLSKIRNNKSNVLAPLLLVMSAWIVSFVLCILPTSSMEIKYPERTGCRLVDLFEDKTTIILSFLMTIYLVPQIFTNILYVLACFRLKILLTQVFPSSNSTSTEIRSCEAESLPTEMSANRSKVQIQKKILGTIGLVMLILNLCTIPEVVLLKLGNNNTNFRYMLSALFLLRSALNPFVYAYRTKWIRLALKKMFIDCIKNLF